MVSDSIPHATASSNPNDFVKRKRANRSAKLRQCKLDARREQWLSQVKSKDGCKEELNGIEETRRSPASFGKERGMPKGNLEMQQRVGKEIHGGGLSRHHDSDSDSFPSNSPISYCSSILGSNGSPIKFSTSSGSNSRRSSSSSNDFFPCGSEYDEGDEINDGGDVCLDDWEAMADALSAPADKQQEHVLELSLPPSVKCGNSARQSPRIGSKNQPVPRNVISKQETGETVTMTYPAHTHAWRVDDAFRPHSLPNLPGQHFNRRQPTWGRATNQLVPTSCPICYEDFDYTDSSFLPCSCGFRLCLFCHKTILERDGRCPACRKQYVCRHIEGEPALDGKKLTFQLIRSHSMRVKR